MPSLYLFEYDNNKTGQVQVKDKHGTEFTLAFGDDGYLRLDGCPIVLKKPDYDKSAKNKLSPPSR